MHTPTDHEVETYSGRFVNVANPDPETIDLYDIAWALSQTCRYGGHCRSYLSVADHAVFVSTRLERKGYNQLVQLAGLHHDDSEYVLGDIPRPIKPLLGEQYEYMTRWMDYAIVLGLKLPFELEPLSLGLPSPVAALHDQAVKDADTWALLVEARYLLLSQGRHWPQGSQGSNAWGLEDQPSRIVTPDYWLGGLTSEAACARFVDRHDELMKGLGI